MGQLHFVISQQGKQAALDFEPNRAVVEAAATYMADEDVGMGFLYSGWCQAALPHKRLPDDEVWQIRSDHVHLLVQPGARSTDAGPAQGVGVPYGSRARLIMFYLQSKALKSLSREVTLGRSMNHWLHRMGVPLGGRSILSIRDQAERISRCTLTFDIKGTRSEIGRMTIFDRAAFFDLEDGHEQAGQFPQVATLSEQFFKQLTSHPVPLEEAAVRAISNNSMSLDVYAWLAYRLHALKAPTPVSWIALKAQFGTGFTQVKNFRITFLEVLKIALAVYPQARVDIEDQGVRLYHSPPPVAPKVFPVKSITSNSTP